MKKLLLASTVLAMLLFTGCSQKNPDVDMSGKDGSSSSQVADKKANDISGMDSNNMDSNAKNAQNAVEQAIAMLEGKVQTVYFDFDKYDIRSDMQPVVQTNADVLSSNEAKDFSIKVEGNCDEWGTDEYNYALGLKRAKSVKDAIVSMGVSADRVMVVSFGESNPTCKESNKSCWDKNRRAEFKLLP